MAVTMPLSGIRGTVAHLTTGDHIPDTAPATATQAAQELAAGRSVIVVDRSDGFAASIVLAAELASPQSMAFLVRHTSGFVCVAMPTTDLVRLDLPPMRGVRETTGRPDFAVSVDAATGVSTGISAADRARTVRLLADPKSSAGDLTRPGHVIPIRTGSDVDSPTMADSVVHLCRLAGMAPAAALSEIVTDSGATTTSDDVAQLCRLFGLRWFEVCPPADGRRPGARMLDRIIGWLPSAHLPDEAVFGPKRLGQISAHRRVRARGIARLDGLDDR